MQASSVIYKGEWYSDLGELLLRLADVAGADVAVRFAGAVDDLCENLRETPELGRRRADLRHPGIRSMVVSGFPKYVLFYQYGESSGELVFVRLLYGARDLSVLLD